MRVGLILGLIAVVAIVIATVFGFSVNVSPVYSVCQRNDELSSDERAEIVEAGQAFIELVRDGDVAAVRAAMSREAREGADLAALERVVRAAREMTSDPALEETYLIFAPLGSREGMSMCGSPSRPALVARHGGTRVALATFTQSAPGASRTWTLYFERDDGAWRVRHLHFGLSEIGGRSGSAIRELAQSQASAGHAFNATILYDIAATLLFRGESFQPDEAFGLTRDREALQRHPEISGDAPHTFQLGEQSFAIGRLEVTGTGDQSLVLLLEQLSDRPVTEAEAIVRNRALIDAMNTYRPEWREAFDALVASYPTGPNTTWRTVYARDEGYLPVTRDDVSSEASN